jgi:hypothetical protein
MRYCAKCGLTKDESDFFNRKHQKDGLDKHCKECVLGRPLTKTMRVVVNGQKKCNGCGKTLPVSDFHLNSASKNGYAARCKECSNAENRERRKILKNIRQATKVSLPIPSHKVCSICNIDKPAEDFPKFQKVKLRNMCKSCSNKIHNTKRRMKNLRINFNMSLEEYEVKIAQQNSKCKICGSTEQDGVALAVDHDHNTGEVRGLLCRTCNLMLGFAKDNISILKQSIKYLRHYARKTN